MGFESGWLARVTLRASKGSQEVVNTLHYTSDLSWPSPDASLLGLAERLRDDLMVSYRALFTSAWTIDPVEVVEERDPLNPNDPRRAASAGPGGAGTRVPGTEVAASGLCIVVRELSDFVGRRFNGRIFLGGSMAEQDLEGDVLDAPTAGNFAGLADAFLADIPLEPDIVVGPDSDTVNLCVFSRTQRAAGLDPYAAHVVSFARGNTIKWLRSRQAGN